MANRGLTLQVNMYMLFAFLMDYPGLVKIRPIYIKAASPHVAEQMGGNSFYSSFDR